MRRPWALPLVPLYAAGLAHKNRRFNGGHSVQTLPRPVVSVGSLSAGGAGKTPAVLALATLLARHGVGTDVLSRGYGRISTEVERVDPHGQASRFGDEPLELARAGLEVYVGRDRFEAGMLAERTGNAKIHLLDDGFQHRQLARTVDLVLLTAEDCADGLLPAGNLREPLAALARADTVLVREEEADRLRPLLASRTPATLLSLRRTLSLGDSLASRPLAFCAIARPEGFFHMLRAAGASPIATRAWPDHHVFTPADLTWLETEATRTGAHGFITTAKDLARLAPAARARLVRHGPLRVATLTVSFPDETAVLDLLLSALHPFRSA